MPILKGDIKLLKSERMTDNDDGGGRITGNEIQDGVSNEIFNDVSDLDRVYGRTSLRKAFAGVETDDTDYYFGSHLIIDQKPEDSRVSVLAFSTGSATDERTEARSKVEGYVVSGPLSRMRLYGDQLEGQRSVLAYQRSGENPPDIGDVLHLETEDGPYAGEHQFVRVNEVSTQDQVFTDGLGDFVRQVVTIGISTQLNARFYGHEPMRTSGTQPDTRLRRTMVADASRYYGISKLAMAAGLGTSKLQVDSIYQSIVPSTQTETAVVDVPIGGDVQVEVDSGGITHEIPQVAETDRIAVRINNRGFTYTRNLQPLPAPGTVVVEYRALGRWYTLRDEEGDGELTGAGTGQVDFTTGSVMVTLQAMPDADTDILFFWGTPIHYVDRASYQVPFPTPSLRFTLEHGGVVPGSVTATWISGGVEVTATDDGQGNLTGAATGRMVYGFQDATNGDRMGEIWVEFNDGAWPDANSNVVVDYQHGASDTATFNPNKDGAGFVQLQLPNAPIKPGSVSLEWMVDHRDFEASGGTIKESAWKAFRSGRASWAEYSMGYSADHVSHFESRYEENSKLTYIARDDGAGNLPGFEGVIDYDTGLVTLRVELEGKMQRWDRNDADGDATWKEVEVGETFADGSAVIARWQPQTIGSTAGSVSQSPSPLRVDLLPLLQDQIVPTTLRFTFRGSIYEDRSGSLYRDVDPNTGAGILSGSIDYSRAEVVLEDWGPSGSNQIAIISLVTLFGNWTIYNAFFRTPGSPIQVGGLTLMATTGDGDLLSGQSDFEGAILGDTMEGAINYTTGVAVARFGTMVADSSLTTEQKNEPWYDPANIDGSGNIWKPRAVLPTTARFNAVVLASLPLDAELLGLDPVRLPSDGRVPIFRPANVAVVHNTASTPWPIGTAAGDTLDVGRTRLAFLRIEDSNGQTMPATDHTNDLNAGTVTINPGVDLTGYTEPLYATHRIEDMVLLGDVQIGGELTIIGQLSHDYPADTTYVSSALIAGDLQARWTNLFDQSTWTNEWSDSLLGSSTTAEYSQTLYPLEVTNRGAITERWALIFTSSTTFRVVGESVGQIVSEATIDQDLAPINPNTGVPYFWMDRFGWGSGWSAGNVVRFNTVGATYPIWLARTVLQGEAEDTDFSFHLQIRGNINRDPA